MMNRNLLIAIGIGIIILAGGGLFVASQKNSSSNEVMTKEESTDDAMMKKDSRYVEYSKSALDQAAGNRRVLYFYANWCPTCRPTDANLKQNVDKIPQDLIVIRVNYNDSDTDQEEKDLAKKYDVIYQHTFVQIDNNGNQVTKWSGGAFEDIIANIK